MTPDDAVLLEGVIAIVVVALFGVITQRERIKREDAEKDLASAHKWVDEIIEALQNPDESQGHERADRLVDQFRPDGRTGDDQSEVLRK